MSTLGAEPIRIDPTGRPTLVLRRFSYRYRARVLNVGALAVYLGNTGVTPAAAYRLPPGDDIDVTVDDEVYGCVLTGTVLPVDAFPALLSVINESGSVPQNGSTPVVSVST